MYLMRACLRKIGLGSSYPSLLVGSETLGQSCNLPEPHFPHLEEKKKKEKLQGNRMGWGLASLCPTMTLPSNYIYRCPTQVSPHLRP